jgi:class 3 adenylate cyclase
MRCAGCGLDNSPDLERCAGCREPLSICCPGCRFDNPPGFSFCGKCGHALDPDAPRPAPEAQTPPSGRDGAPPPVVERRHLTIVFCDVVDSTSRAERLDPEDLRALMLRYQSAAGRAIARYAGHVAQYLGDGLLAYFGYPEAHEDDARRALYASLEIVDAIAALNAELMSRWQETLSVRIGVHSGDVVMGAVGTDLRSENLALGQTPNIAARLQALADPNEVILSASTERIVAGYFETESRGPATLRGVSDPVEVFRLLGETPAGNRFQALSRRGLSPFVGREAELSTLRALVDRVAAGSGEVALVLGEAGIGKSRLVRRAALALEDEVQWITLTCSPYHGNSAMYPVSVYLSRLMDMQAQDDDPTRQTRLERFLEDRGIAPATAVPLLAPVLGLRPDRRHRALPPSPKRVREETFAVLRELLFGGRHDQPLVVLIEDVHWMDPSTRELLDDLVQRMPDIPALLLLTSRPGIAIWPPSPHLHLLALRALDREETRALLGTLLEHSSVPDWMRTEIEARTDGVPIFVEELTRMLVESWEKAPLDAGPQALHAIPKTLHDSLEARLEGLGSARGTLQLASVLGRAFDYELLREVSGDDDSQLSRNLRRLVGDDLLVSRDDDRAVRFRFRHALIQDAAYESMLRSDRVRLHAEVARVLEARFPELMERRPELVADHLTRAQLPAEALPYWLAAGRGAVQRNALEEAVNLFRNGLALLSGLEGSPDQRKAELRIQVGIGNAIANATHWGNPDVTEAFERAAALCAELEDPQGEFRCRLSLRMNYTSQGRHRDAADQAARALAVAEHWGEPDALAQALAANVHPAWHLGRFEVAQAHGEACLEALASLPDSRFVREQRLFALAYMVQAVWATGRFERCRELLDEGEALVEHVENPYARGFFLVWGGTALLYLRHMDRYETVLRRGCSIAEEHGYGALLQWGRMQQAWLLARQGRAEEGLSRLEEAFERYLALGAGADLPLCHVLVAEARLLAGTPEGALESIHAALARGDETHEHCHRVEALRVLAEVHAALGRHDRAQERLEEAVRVATEQESLGWRLRAALSLARLQLDTGDRGGARRTLHTVREAARPPTTAVDALRAADLLDELDTIDG